MSNKAEIASSQRYSDISRRGVIPGLSSPVDSTGVPTADLSEAKDFSCT
jgi:hypothetical protein